MSDLIVTKPFLRGSKRYRRGEAAPTDLDKVTQDDYLRLGLLGRKRITSAALAPSNTNPAGPAQTTVPSTGRKRESAKPRDVKATTATNAAPTDATATTSVGAPAGPPDGSVHTSAPDSGVGSGAAVDAANGAEVSDGSTNQADGAVHTSAQEVAKSVAEATQDAAEASNDAPQANN